MQKQRLIFVSSFCRKNSKKSNNNEGNRDIVVCREKMQIMFSSVSTDETDRKITL